MRVARLLGLSPDGRYVIVATDRGQELAIAADDRLRAALRGDRPRLGQLEIEMESALSPREIQTRIRSGESVDDVARAAGVDRDRVERFAAPVLAEREHVAGLAMTSSARRRGETSSHRTLRGVLTERLLSRGVDTDTVRWDSYRLDDGRWAVTADYLSGETPRQALFYFDVPGRYSVAGNDEGRWVLGDTSASRGPQPDRQPPVPGGSADDTEPTLDLSDELALVRAIQDVPVAPSAGSEYEVDVSEVQLTMARVVQFDRGNDADATETESVEPAEPEPAEPEPAEPEPAEPEPAEPEPAGPESIDESGLDALYEIFDDQDPSSEPPDEAATVGVADPEGAEPTIEVARSAAGGQGEPGVVPEDSAPSDASAVPELDVPLRSEAWEPAIVVDYPVEPSEDSDDVDGVEVPEGSDDPGRPEVAVAREDRRDEAATLEVVQVVSEPDSAAESEITGDDESLPIEMPEQSTPPPTPKPARRKRASVPSWDEIVFGGPQEK